MKQFLKKRLSQLLILIQLLVVGSVTTQQAFAIPPTQPHQAVAVPPAQPQQAAAANNVPGLYTPTEVSLCKHAIRASILGAGLELAALISGIANGGCSTITYFLGGMGAGACGGACALGCTVGSLRAEDRLRSQRQVAEANAGAVDPEPLLLEHQQLAQDGANPGTSAMNMAQAPGTQSASSSYYNQSSSSSSASAQ
jgi:hypothetical protein